MTTQTLRPTERDHPGVFASYGELLPLIFQLERRGVVVTASDTCYGVFCAATDREAVGLVRKLSGSVDPLPVTVGSVREAAALLQLSESHQGFLSALWPGAFTAVARTTRRARKFVDNVNSTSETLGLRVTTASLEAALARECDVPIVSTAVRYENGMPVRVGTDASRIISNAMTRNKVAEARVLFLKKDEFRYPTHSTVGRMTTSPDLVDVLRAGVYSDDDIRGIVRAIASRTLAPNTIAPLHSSEMMRSWLDDPDTLKDVT